MLLNSLPCMGCPHPQPPRNYLNCLAANVRYGGSLVWWLLHQELVTVAEHCLRSVDSPGLKSPQGYAGPHSQGWHIGRCIRSWWDCLLQENR